MTWDQLTIDEITTVIPERTVFNERIKNNSLVCALSFLVNTTALIYKKELLAKLKMYCLSRSEQLLISSAAMSSFKNNCICLVGLAVTSRIVHLLMNAKVSSQQTWNCALSFCDLESIVYCFMVTESCRKLLFTFFRISHQVIHTMECFLMPKGE